MPKKPTANISRRRRRRIEKEDHSRHYHLKPYSPRDKLLHLNRVAEGRHKTDQRRKEEEVDISAVHGTSDLQGLVEPRHSNPSSLGAGNSKGISFQTQIGEVGPSTLPLEASTSLAIDHVHALPSSSNFTKPTSSEANAIEASSHYKLRLKIEAGKPPNPPPSPNQYKVPQDPFELSHRPNRHVISQQIAHHVEPSDSSLSIYQPQDPPNLLLEYHPTELHPTNLLPTSIPIEVEDIAQSTSTTNCPGAWQIASQSLMAGPKGRRLAQLEDILAEDVPIRAILYGWDALGEPWELPPFWKNIRQLDEKLLVGINKVERLAIWRIMHLLMCFHSDPSPRRAAKLPPYYSRRIEFPPTYYIGHYFPWPGVRELAKNPCHPFRSSAWFRTEIKTFKFLWPGGIHDCYTRSPETGLFKLSPAYDARLFDINCWTYGPEMFESFPMTYGVAPAWNTIPPSLRGGVVKAGYRHNIEEDWRSGLVRLMQKVPVDYRKLKWGYEIRNGRTALYYTLW